MATFKDKRGREWLIDIDVNLLEQVQKRTDVRIDQLIANKAAGLEELLGDPLKFVRVLWVLVEEQAEKLSVAPEQFGGSLGGDSLENAANAFLEGLAEFFPQRQRKILRAMQAQGTKIAEERTAKILQTIQELDPASSTTAMTSPEFSGSTPVAAG